MITAPQDYLEVLYQIQNKNVSDTAILLPKDEPIYEVNLDKRVIQAPEFLSVKQDHNAETIYFKADRYFDGVDLSTTTCVVQYLNASTDTKKNGYIYLVPYIDTTTFEEQNQIVFPWVIEGPATAYSGNVTFSIKFYEIDQNSETGEYFYNYSLNTIPSVSKVLTGMDIANASDSENYIFEASEIERIYQEISEIRSASGVFWVDVD